MVYKAGVLTVSDTASQDSSQDKSGPLLVDLLKETNAYSVQQQAIVADDIDAIQATVKHWCDQVKVDLVLITGGTGFSARDTTPEAIDPLLSKHTLGLTHVLLATSTAVTPFAALSRPVTGIRHNTLVITFPGKPKACKENWDAIKNIVPHGLDLLRGDTSRQHPVHQHHHHHHHHHHHKVGGHRCKHHSDDHGEHKGFSASLDTPVALRARTSPYPIIPMSEAEALVRKHSTTRQRIIADDPISMQVSENLIGHVLAEDAVSVEPVPGYRASIVDGYAVRASKGPGIYTVGSVSLASDSTSATIVSEDEIVRTATGGLVPDCMDAVVMVEDTRLVKMSDDGKEELQVEIMAKVEAGDNIRAIGSDCQTGTIVGYKGQVISSVGGELGALASAGIQNVKVYRKPTVGVLSTGNEVVDHLATKQLKQGEIRDTNRITLLGAIRGAGFEAMDLGIIKDTVDDLETRLRDALEKVDVLITTGGVSMGEADFMKPVLEQKLGATIHFGRVKMKPGKPTTFASIPDTGKLIFALPGNPASATVTFYLFVLPALKKIAGYAQFTNPIIPVKITEQVYLDPRPEYHRVRVSVTPKGEFVAESTGGQRSSRMLSLLQANGLLQLPAASEDQSQLPSGTQVPCLLIGSLNPYT